MGPGFLFSAQLEDIAAQAAHLGSWLAFLLGGGLGTFIVYKYVHRHRLLRELRTARISVDELNQMRDEGRDHLIVDLRGALHHQADPYTIPGALRMPAEELDHGHHGIPSNRVGVLFCAWP